MICLPTDGFDAIVSMTEGEPLLARSLLRHISSIALSMESNARTGNFWSPRLRDSPPSLA
jgi:hypothetical protein